MSVSPDRLETEAVDWVIRSRAVDFADWDALTDWMARSGEHADAFNRLAALDDAVAAALVANPAALSRGAANDREHSGERSGWQGPVPGRRSFMSLLVVLCLVVSAWLAWPRAVVIETAPGETREVRLDDGVTAWLNGNTRIEYRRDEPRSVELGAGEAFFAVRHGSGAPLEVEAGGIVMRDLGTRFNVVHSATGTELAVAEGKVVFDAAGAALTLAEGQGARVGAGSTGLERFELPVAQVAGWRAGKLVYRDVPVNRIAEDLARRTGESVIVDPRSRAIRFTGTIAADGSPVEAVQQAANMLGLPVSHGSRGWVLGGNDTAKN